MAFDVSTLTPYVNETAEALIAKAVATGKTIDLVTVQPGIKYKETVNILDNTITVQDGDCGFTPYGDVNIKQREIEVYPLKINDELCEQDLEKYFLGMKMSAGTPKTEELGAILADSYVKEVQKYNELNIWKGKLTTPTYGKIEGFISILGSEATRVTPTLGTPDEMPGPFTSSTIINVVNQMVASIPEEILDRTDLKLFLSMANFNLYTSALRTANQYITPAVGANGTNFTYYVPGTNVELVATYGLTGTDYMVLTYAKNLIVGTDLLNENEKFDISYNPYTYKVQVAIFWKLGTQVQFPEFCVCNF